MPPIHVILIAAIIILFIGARSLASLVIEYQWWKELGQLQTWQSIILFSFAPQAAATVLAFIALWIAHARGLKSAGTGLREHPAYARIATAVLFVLGLAIAQINLSGWTIVSFVGSLRAGQTSGWRDPIFGRALSFYLFDLPFYSQLTGFLLALTFFAAAAYFVASFAWRTARKFPGFNRQGTITLDELDLPGSLSAPMLRVLLAFFFLLLALRTYLARYSYLDDEHSFMVGVDYVAHNITLPLQWLAVAGLIAAGLLMVAGRWRLALVAVALVIVRNVVPPLVSAAYVKPNELSLQRPYIQHHIAATRAAYGLDSRLKEEQFPAKLEAKLDLTRYESILENVRLWDWRVFHDTVTQIQALRQYYVFADTDVDRYMIGGKLQQVMLTPRELDIRQLADARANWINAHFIYTHGYGLVMAQANRITPSGQPVLFIHDAPPKVEIPGLKLTRPEIYYGEVTHEPVVVRTQQAEFNYPSGAENVQTRYEGKGGIRVGSFPMRLASAVAYMDRNMLLTGYLNPDSRMMIHRKVRDRVSKLANFIDWDTDPYLVVTQEGRLVWMIDGYTSSWRHPYSRRIRTGQMGTVNYVRNSVKATVDAYDGNVSMYIFDSADPIVRSYQSVFPNLFQPASRMPGELRAHARYPEFLFRAQTEIYRTFHMQDPEAFYNKEDLWDLAKTIYSEGSKDQSPEAPFVVASLPGERTAEFLLIQPFTPRNKDNLIGLMLARCDGDRLGEIVVLHLSKQSLIYGPLQIDARIGSDQNIAKDLALWNQQGSQVLRGQMLVLPIGETFLYVEPIYIQSSQARMPQLKKVVLAMGNTLIYEDTYEQALAKLAATMSGTPPVMSSSTAPAPGAAPAAETQTQAQVSSSSAGAAQIDAIRGHLRRYRDLSSKGRWSEAGRELEALDKLVNAN